MNSLIKKINEINPNILKCNFSLKNFNTMKLECRVKYFIMPTSFVELKKVLLLLKEMGVGYYIIGNGSNIIFTEKEKECIIKLNFKKSCYDFIMVANDLLMIKSHEFYNKGYKGMEYVSNIPASIGGAIFMNAGAYDHFFSDIIEYVYYLDENLKFKVIGKEMCGFSYRKSIFKDSNKVILGCKVILKKEDKEVLKNIMQKCKEKRATTQPLELPNSGSIFKNIHGISAWKLIEFASLRGFKRNDAMISVKHCNFIVNLGNAKSDDVIYLINLMKNRVKKVFDINLEEEIIIID